MQMQGFCTSSIYGSGKLMEPNRGHARRVKAEEGETIYGIQFHAFSWMETATFRIRSILPITISVPEKGK